MLQPAREHTHTPHRDAALAAAKNSTGKQEASRVLAQAVSMLIAYSSSEIAAVKIILRMNFTRSAGN